MDVFEAVCTILAVREYKDDPLPVETVRRIVEAAWLSASSMNAQPWHFIVVQDRETIRRLARVATTGPYMANAPLVVVIAIERTKFGVSDGSRAAQSMMLTAWAEGVGSNWVGYMGPEEIKPVLGIPAELDALACIPFGHPAHPGGRGKKKRKPFGQVVHRERFGQPFE